MFSLQVIVNGLSTQWPKTDALHFPLFAHYENENLKKLCTLAGVLFFILHHWTLATVRQEDKGKK